jgi:hypothetical protein
MMPRLRRFFIFLPVAMLLLLAFARPLSAAGQTPTETPTPTLTFGEHLLVKGFDDAARERLLREAGWQLLAAALVVLAMGGVAAWFCAPTGSAGTNAATKAPKNRWIGRWMATRWMTLPAATSST